MIEFKGVSKTYSGSDRPVVNDLTFNIEDGEICVLVGPSGCGKTTSMRMINRLIEPTAGEILIDGQKNTSMSGTQLRRKIGYAIQQIGLFPHRTIGQNVGTVPGLVGWDKERTSQRGDGVGGPGHPGARAAAPGRGASGRPRSAPASAWTSCSTSSASRPTSTATATRPSSPAASSSGSGWRGPWRRGPRPGAWTSRSGRWTRASVNGHRSGAAPAT